MQKCPVLSCVAWIWSSCMHLCVENARVRQILLTNRVQDIFYLPACSYSIFSYSNKFLCPINRLKATSDTKWTPIKVTNRSAARWFCSQLEWRHTKPILRVTSTNFTFKNFGNDFLQVFYLYHIRIWPEKLQKPTFNA